MAGRLRRFRNAGVVAFVAAMLVGTAGTVTADDLMDLVYTDTETREDHSESYSTPKARGNLLAYGAGSVTRVSADEVGVYGETAGVVNCNLTLGMYLERKNPETNEYCSYMNWTLTEDSSGLVIDSRDILVPSGYFYRLKTYHAAKSGVTRESTYGTTLGVYIGKKMPEQ